MDPNAPGETDEVLTAGEFIAREVLAEVEAAVASSKQCTAVLRVAELEPLGVTGLRQPIYACKTCAAENGGSPVGVWCVDDSRGGVLESASRSRRSNSCNDLRLFFLSSFLQRTVHAALPQRA